MRSVGRGHKALSARRFDAIFFASDSVDLDREHLAAWKDTAVEYVALLGPAARAHDLLDEAGLGLSTRAAPACSGRRGSRHIRRRGRRARPRWRDSSGSSENGGGGESAAQHGLVLLAAGRLRRLGVAEQLLGHRGRAARAARRAPCARDVAPRCGRRDRRRRKGRRGRCPRPRRPLHRRAGFRRGDGQVSRGWSDAPRSRVRGRARRLCDQPALTAEHLAALVEAWRAVPSSAAASGYAGTVGVPAVLPRAWFPSADGGPRRPRRARPPQGKCRRIRVVPDERLGAGRRSPRRGGRALLILTFHLLRESNVPATSF